MSLPSNYLVFAAIIGASVSAVVIGAQYVRRLDPRMQIVLTITWLAMHALALLTGVGGPALSNVLVIGSGIGVATLIARTLRAPGSLVALALTASIIDIVSFSSGPTRWLLDSESSGVSKALRFLAVSFRSGQGLRLVVGVGDLLIFGALFLGLTEQGHRGWVAWVVLMAGLLAALAVGLARGGAFGIPFMAIGAISLYLWGRRTASA